MSETYSIEQLRALYQAATSGEWEVDQISETHFGWRVGVNEVMQGLGQVNSLVADGLDKDDAAFVAAAHNTLPALIERLGAAERLLSEIVEWYKVLDTERGTHETMEAYVQAIEKAQEYVDKQHSAG